MPMAMCPMCGSQMHLNVADPERFAAAHPEREQLGCAVLPCFLCWQDLDVGSRVRIRSTAARLAPHLHQTGVVEALSKVGGLPVARIVLDEGGTQVMAIRAELEVVAPG